MGEEKIRVPLAALCAAVAGNFLSIAICSYHALRNMVPKMLFRRMHIVEAINHVACPSSTATSLCQNDKQQQNLWEYKQSSI